MYQEYCHQCFMEKQRTTCIYSDWSLGDRDHLFVIYFFQFLAWWEFWSTTRFPGFSITASENIVSLTESDAELFTKCFPLCTRIKSEIRVKQGCTAGIRIKRCFSGQKYRQMLRCPASTYTLHNCSYFSPVYNVQELVRKGAFLPGEEQVRKRIMGVEGNQAHKALTQWSVPFSVWKLELSRGRQTQVLKPRCHHCFSLQWQGGGCL